MLAVLAMFAGSLLTNSFGQKATAFSLEGQSPGVVGESRLYITVNRNKILVEPAALAAWLIGGGSEIAYSTFGGGGFSGQRLYVYDVATTKTRGWLAKYGLEIVGLSEIRLSNGSRAVLVRLTDVTAPGEDNEASYLAIIDAVRGQVLFLENAEANSVIRDRISITYFREGDWARINKMRTKAFFRLRTAIVPRAKFKPQKTEILDLKKVLKNEPIVDDGF